MTARPDPGGEVNPLVTLLHRCVVRIDCDGRFEGSGFFVAPGEVLTCAHVVHGRERITVSWGGGVYPATLARALPRLEVGDPRAGFFPLPDVALLRLASPPSRHPCVRFDAREPVAGPPPDVLRIAAYTTVHDPDVVALTGATTDYEGPVVEDGRMLLQLKNGRVIGGFSGAPLLNTRTGGVCGLVESTRDGSGAVGGFGVPLTEFLPSLAGVEERNQAYHGDSGEWDRTVEEERRLAAWRAGEWNRLPLVEPLLELEWDSQGSRANLLHPRHRVVPFVGRQELLGHLMLWRERTDPLGVVVLASAGGFGKTRTAVEVCIAAQRAGWTTGMIATAGDQPSDHLDRLAGWPGRLVVAVDYAETRPGTVADLLGKLLRRAEGPPVRVILVVRQATTKRQLRDLFATGDGRLEVDGLIHRAEVVNLAYDQYELDRATLFEQATAAFSHRLGVSRPSQAPALEAGHFTRPLFVLAAALLATEDGDVDVDALSADDLLDEVLRRHEAEYWDRWNHRLSVGLERDDQRRLVAMAAWLGAETEDEAIALVQMVPGFTEKPRPVAKWLSHLYGSGRLADRPAVVPLEPDLLAEVLIARELVSGGLP